MHHFWWTSTWLFTEKSSQKSDLLCCSGLAKWVTRRFSIVFPKTCPFPRINLDFPQLIIFHWNCKWIHFSCEKQSILYPLGALSKPSWGPSGDLLLCLLNSGKLSVPAALKISSCITQTIFWQLFLGDLESSNFFGESSYVSALFLTSISLLRLSHAGNVSIKHNGTIPDADSCAYQCSIQWHLHNCYLA